MKTGLAGKLAGAFINSKLTPLIILASLLTGGFAVLRIPREEEPQIIVPMADVIVAMPGSSAKEVETRVTAPLEKLIWEIPGVEYVYSTTTTGQSMVIVRFLVGQDQERALVRLREKIQSHYDLIPPGASQPIIKPRSIDDVPILALTLHSHTVDAVTLRQVALRVEQAVKSVPNVSETAIIGGRKRELRVDLDQARLAGFGLTSSDVAAAISRSNHSEVSGKFSSSDQEKVIRGGQFFSSQPDLEACTVGVSNGHPIHLNEVATLSDGGEEPGNYVQFTSRSQPQSSPKFETGVTLSIAKRQGVNAIDVVGAVMAKLDTLKGTLIPSDIEVTTTRNYGATSAEKSNELLVHMGIAVLSVTLLIALVLGWKESMVVLVAIPVTLALTLLVFYLYGFTLNRITLFALIFSIGILVDDAIVVVENIVRHLRMPAAKEAGPIQTAITAVDEVGNPTILATFAVIAAILPMAFVGGLMGPYMRPIPVGASSAMLFSLLIAFIVTPWAAVRILKNSRSGRHAHDEDGPEDGLTRLYRRIMTPLLRSWKVRTVFFGSVFAMLLGAMALVGIKAVTVKMLPFDNKNEFQIIVDMPTGTTLERTAAAAQTLAAYTRMIPEVTDCEVYAGTSGPYNFNGLVRHYFTRAGSNQADIQVNLVDKADRKAQSHDIVRRIREDLALMASQLGARIKVAEVPPGPPVLETLVAEVYGPDSVSRLDTATKIKQVFNTTEGVSDVDWYMDDDQSTTNLKVDDTKAAASGVSVQAASEALTIALAGSSVGLLHDESAREDVPIILRLPRAERSGLEKLAGIRVHSSKGGPVPLTELVSLVEVPTDKTIYHKNLLPVVYVTGDVVGKHESPVYAILKMDEAIDKLKLPKGIKLNVLSTHLPEDTSKPAMKWDGEWHITYEVFRDLGVAFAAVLVLIYILVVAWFQNFKTPLVIMAPIPLTLVGILPAHAMMGAFFTATSMIGFIAGAGIIVRNSIILVDFIELRRRQGSTLEQAVVDAGAIRFRPMLLTAAAVIVGSFVILFDPIFQGLAIALMAGEIASTLLSRIAVPVLYFLSESKAARN